MPPTMGLTRARPWIEWGLVAVALALAAYRFINLADAAFINDEAIFLDAARMQLVSGTWASANPIAGSHGNFYGPSVMWFYGAVHWALGSRALTSIAAMCLFVTGSQVVLCAALARRFGGSLRESKGRWIFALTLLFLASSPHQYFWSRLAWDQLTLGIPCLVIALLCGERLGALRCLAIGVLLGFGFSSHPMISVFCALTGLVLFVELVRTPRRLWVLGPLLAGAVAINIPYLLFLKGRAAPSSVTGAFELTWSRALDTFRPATLWQLDYFFDGDWAAFAQWTSLASAPLAWGCLGLVAALTLFGLIAGLPAADWPRRRVLLLGLSTLVVSPLFFAWRGLAAHPHYQFPNGWLTPAAFAAALSFGFHRKFLRAGLAGLILCLALVQTLFIVRWNSFITANGGTRGVHYSVPVGRTEAVVREVCAAAAPTAVLHNLTLVLPNPLEYHALTDPACAGKTIVICPAYGCTAPAGAQQFQLQYAGEAGGAVTLQKVGAP